MKKLDKHFQSKAWRAKLRELYEYCIDAAEFGIDEIRSEIIQLKSNLQELERSMRKNEKYEGLEVPPHGHKISGEVIGVCKHCEREVYAGQKFPNPKEEGLFCNYYCRTVYRNKNNIKVQ